MNRAEAPACPRPSSIQRDAEERPISSPDRDGMTGSPTAVNNQLDPRPRARKASPPHLAVGRADGDRQLKSLHLVADRDRVATAAAPAGVGHQRNTPTRQPVQRRADQPPDEWIDGAVQDDEAAMSGGHRPRLVCLHRPLGSGGTRD